MGWLFHNKWNTPNTYAEIKAEVINLHRAAADAPVRYEVLQAAQVGVFWVCAVKVTPLTAERAEQMRNDSTYTVAADGSYTYASIIKTARHEGGWGYKDMDEGAGVYGDFSKCPASLIAKLSPLKDAPAEGYDRARAAREWRESILAAKGKAKIKEGDRIRLQCPALFGSAQGKIGTYCREFEVTHYQRRGRKMRCYKALDMGGMLVRLTAGMVAGAEIIA